MQSQQHQSLSSSTLRLIDERLEAIMSSADQSTTVSNLIQTFLDEIMNPINPLFRWELIMNTMFAGMRYSLTIWEHWGRHKAVTANVNYDSDKLTFTSGYVNSKKQKETIIIDRRALETGDTETRDRLETFLISCQTFSYLCKDYDDGYTRSR